jgi:hypothetical protein
LSEHTPGPWEWGAHPWEDMAQVYAPAQPATDRTVADVWTVPDAMLIAAAPDLLAACEMLQDFWTNPDSDVEIPTILRTVHAALAKAHGEVPA